MQQPYTTITPAGLTFARTPVAVTAAGVAVCPANAQRKWLYVENVGANPCAIAPGDVVAWGTDRVLTAGAGDQGGALEGPLLDGFKAACAPGLSTALIVWEAL